MKSLMRVVACASAVAAFTAVAQDDFDFGDGDSGAAEAVEPAEGGEATGEGAEGADETAPAKAANPADNRLFSSLPFCRKLVGSAEVLKPGATAWAPVEEGKFYPLGSFYRTTDDASALEIQFGGEDTLVGISRGAASFGTHFQPIGEKTRRISLQGGVIDVKLPRNLPDGAFKITAPSFTIVNPKGESRYAFTRTVDGEVAQIRCVTGFLSVEGRHFKFPELKAANEIKIRSSQDQLFTGLYGKSGVCPVILDQGDMYDKDYSTGETSVAHKTLEWKLSPKTAARIYRAVPSIGERMAVTVMTFDAAGSLKNRCAFVEGRPEVNTGELAATVGSDKEEAARKAAAAAEAVEAEVDVEADSDSGDGASDDAAVEAATADAAAESDDFDF
ncbi:MAG: hypothetical protein J6P13_02835 [Kiritimatiellae bacterium]|nr:hypothetical protein [Kiritimatiellia bacterium]